MRRWTIVLLGVAALYFVLSPFLTVYQMRSAAEQRDGETLAEHIEFPSVRQDLKDQLNLALGMSMAEEVEDNPFAVLGGLLGGVIIDKVVDAYVTPAGITQLMKGEVPEEASTGDGSTSEPHERPFEGARYRYDAWDKFSVTMTDEDDDEVKFVLRRRGIGWKLTGIKLPLAN
jgi:hypothetical protein